MLVDLSVKRDNTVWISGYPVVMDSTTIPSAIVAVISIVAYILFAIYSRKEEEFSLGGKKAKSSTFSILSPSHKAPAPAIFILVLVGVIQTIFGSIIVFLPAFPLVFFHNITFNQMHCILLVLPFFLGISFFCTEIGLGFFREKIALVIGLLFLMLGCGLGFAGTGNNVFVFCSSVGSFAIGIGIFNAIQTPLLIRFLPSQKQELILYTSTLFGLAGNYLGSFWITVTFRSKNHLFVSSIGLIGMTGVAIICCIFFFVKLDPDMYFQNMRQVSAQPLLVVEENDDSGY
eukprot:TRINITY_DN4001_c0_g1_i4.p1 TRINITY_DN4001_c0_g1~~TRINITY_DN4001_c0_g1_i4.p1  ORF type:complete len:288 (-),score=92.61 TRINITY_DN4001_c0_g1_i4:55-918(-)